MAESTTEFHMAKCDVLILSGTSLMALCGLVIAAVLVAWGVGGTDYKNSFYGDDALVVAGAGIVAGAMLHYLGRKCRLNN